MSLNRREFLKFSAGVSAAASSLSGGALQGAANEGEKHVHSFCEMCSSRCPIEAKVVDGKVRFLSGNPKAGAKLAGTRRLTMSPQRCLRSSKSMALKALSLPVKARKRTS